MQKFVTVWGDLKFAYKIAVLPSVACMGFVVLLLISWTAGRKNAELLNTVENGYYSSLELGHALQSDLSSIQRAFQDVATTADLELLAEAEATKAQMDSLIQRNRATTTIDTAKLDNFESAMNAYFERGLSTTASFVGGDTSDRVFRNIQAMNEDYARMQEELTETIRTDGETVREGFKSMLSEQLSATNTILLVIAIVVMIMLAVSVFIIRNTTRAIDSAVRSMNSLSSGNLTASKAEPSADEIGQLLGGVSDVTGTIDSLTSEVGELIASIRDGRLQRRGDSTRFEGAYAQLILNINELIDALVAPIGMTADYVEKISSGHIPAEIKDEYKGDFNKIKRNINILIGAMDGLVVQTGILTTAAKDGLLDMRGDADEFSGAWRDMIVGINETLDAVTIPIHEVSRCMSEMAEGSLTWQITDKHKGQFAALSRDANATSLKLNGVISSIRTAASTIRHGVHEVAAGNIDLSRRTESQAASLEEARANIEVMTDTVTSNAESAKEASEVADSTRDLAEKGEAIVSQAATAMHELSESSKDIVAIIDVIDTIAFQTNLLALNAAVEAARAGEQGRGFAVVASEVRQLAGRSAQAAREIKELIHDSTRKIQEGARLVGNSGSTLGDIMGSVKRVADLVAAISRASQEQRRGIEEVKSVVIELDQVTQQNAELVVEVSSTSESIGVQAGNLTRMLEFFDVDDGTADDQGQAESQPSDMKAVANL